VAVPAQLLILVLLARMRGLVSPCAVAVRVTNQHADGGGGGGQGIGTQELQAALRERPLFGTDGRINRASISARALQ